MRQTDTIEKPACTNWQPGYILNWTG